MSIPAIIVICLCVVSLTRSAIKHGESDGYVSFPMTCISLAITVSLLWWGGFFSPVHVQ